MKKIILFIMLKPKKYFSFTKKIIKNLNAEDT